MGLGICTYHADETLTIIIDQRINKELKIVVRRYIAELRHSRIIRNTQELALPETT